MTEQTLELEATYVRWLDLAAAVPRRLLRAFRRSFRRERRRYLVHAGEIVATFADEEAYMLFLAWVSDTHVETYDLAYKHGGEVAHALHSYAEDHAVSDHPGTA